MADAKKASAEEEQPETPPGREEGAPARALTPEERRALDEMLLDLYKRLKALAARVRWNGANPTMNPTALVHEAYLKLVDTRDLSSKPYEEVIGIFANAMRQILIDASRRKRAQKRGGGVNPEADRFREGAADLAQAPALSPEETLTLEAARGELERVNPRQARVIDCRYFLGLTTEETVQVLGLSKSTVEREEQKAKAFLGGRIRPGPK